MTFDAQQIAQEAAERGEDVLATVVGQALGAASACWENLSGAGVFESTRCAAILDSTLEWLRGQEAVGRAIAGCTPGANLGLATTRELLDELRTRIEVDYFAGGGGLEYSTVAGRPEGLAAAVPARPGKGGITTAVVLDPAGQPRS
jgi:hypothetical protein